VGPKARGFAPPFALEADQRAEKQSQKDVYQRPELGLKRCCVVHDQVPWLKARFAERAKADAGLRTFMISLGLVCPGLTLQRSSLQSHKSFPVDIELAWFEDVIQK
jgi:hypothetical protein